MRLPQNAKRMERAWKWSKKNLFSSPVNAIISLVLLFFMFILLFRFLEWGVLNATWSGVSKESCATNTGACWPFIRVKFHFFMFGFYPTQWAWRPTLYLVIMIAAVFYVFSPKNKKRRMILFVTFLLLSPVLTFILVRGWGSFTVSPDNWGGVLLTVVLSVLGFLFSFPIGVLLALLRTGRFKIIRTFSVCIIEFFRGIPLVTILFMSSVVVPLFFPSEFSVSKLLRLVVGMVLFQSAYLAEVMRGGLQAVPKGQIEAAQSLGLSWWHYTYFVVLPQAIRVSLANITSITIAFVKDTSLVLIVGWFDILGIVKPLSNDIQWLGMEPEGYLLVAILFWGLCVIVSRIGLRLEEAEMSFMGTKK